MIKTESLTKVYGGVKAVDSINVTIEKGEVCGFVGPNGAGKTTTIGMMTGLIEPTSGRCFVKGMEVTKNPLAVKQVIGYLPDGFGLYSHMTAAQNLRYFSKFYGMKEAEANARIAELLGEVGLANVEKKVGAYSRGMKQRLGLARALLNDPEVIFLDEPTNGLDPEGVIQFRRVIKGQAAKGKTIFFSSHILDEVQHVCNTICIISKGKIMAQGTLDDVKRQMRKTPRFSIIVKVDGKMPRLDSPDIIEAAYQDGGATIRASSDLRDFIFDEVVRSGLRVRELRLEEESLEDVFLETVYGGA
ncbi:ABC-type multidrug transport system, ATPase component [Methanocella conradii HZ254]|uniref:ABC-type multidrug transport system, ATPase component n=1 Tax=Methanocella conradii (strain DSM 24694 / JCM 17849 / CGMCC 1.5162 / HZ254) TaxID=1041930 RepID=H8I7N4_METCZ|nr:ABC transporter ATP-binding protein [Methanocella conradii]AFC99869.1 ABC-type multidrug transport system, ATPase component [Methanocella conradii HZ254]